MVAVTVISRLATLVTTVLLLVAAVVTMGLAGEAPLAKYVLNDQLRHAELDISKKDNLATIRLTGGAPDTGAATNADCLIAASGPMANGTLTAIFQPVTTATFSYRRTQAEKERRQIVIEILPGSAEVLSADTLGYCGLSVDFTGVYLQSK